MQIDTETYLAYLRKIFERKGFAFAWLVASQHKPNKMNASLLDNSGGKVHQIKVESLKSFQVLLISAVHGLMAE